MNRKALLIFSDPVGLDLAKRCLPRSLQPLFEGETLRSAWDFEVDAHVFTSARHLCAPTSRLHSQTGSSFAERLENAVETIAALGYEEVVLVGRDCPQLEASDIVSAFVQLQCHQLVLGPDHRGGCYLIAFHTHDRHLLRGVRWRRNTDCDELRERCASSSVAVLAIKYDLDSWSDLAMIAGARDAIGELTRFLLGIVCDCRVALHYFVDLAAQGTRIRGQLPPPAVFA